MTSFLHSGAGRNGYRHEERGRAPIMGLDSKLAEVPSQIRNMFFVRRTQGDDYVLTSEM